MRAGIGKIFGDFPSLALQAWIGKLSTSKPEAQAKEVLKTEPRALIELKNTQLQNLRFGLGLREACTKNRRHRLSDTCGFVLL